MPRQPRHKVFVSYHHENNQKYKDRLVEEMSEDLVDLSVKDGDIDDGIRTEVIWQEIRDEHIADATVVLILIGRHTWSRKFMDWEIDSALNQSRNNSRCGCWGYCCPTIRTMAQAIGSQLCSRREWQPTSKETIRTSPSVRLAR